MKNSTKRIGMKNKILASVIAVLVLAIVAIATVPPPPANQNIGINDTNAANLNTGVCRSCHNPGGTFAQGANTTQFRHHLLQQSGEYICANCHPRLQNPDLTYYVVYEKNCLNCHNGSTFWANPSLTPGLPHHNTTWAYADKNCSLCHGGYVDRIGDGHPIPTTPPSEVTPDTSFKATNATSGRHWGGCESCHIANNTVAPFPIKDNDFTHHNLGKVTEGYPVPSSGCLACHSMESGALNIRTCEGCHGIKSLHNIQYNYTTTIGQEGYGHIGDGDKDCLGCHSWYVAGEALPPTVPIPEINTITPSDMAAGAAKEVTIVGSNFIAGPVATVAIDGTSVAPTSITNDQIVVTVPALTVGTHTIEVVKGDVRSRLYSLVVVTPVDAIKAQITRTKSPYQVSITGTGFGTKPDAIYEPLGVWITTNGKSTKAKIVSWSATKIVVSTTTKPVRGNPVTIKNPFGQDTVNIS